MAPAFGKAEYDSRLAKVRKAMQDRGLDAMVIGDPANINWLSGYDAWSFYTPQVILVDLQDGPFWVGRLMDAGAAKFTTYLSETQVVAYPETLVQRPDIHPMAHLPTGWRIGDSPPRGSAMKATAISSPRGRWQRFSQGFRTPASSMPICW